MGKGRGKKVFRECCAEVRRMIAGEISGEELSQRSEIIALRHNISLSGVLGYRPTVATGLGASLLTDDGEIETQGEEVAVNG